MTQPTLRTLRDSDAVVQATLEGLDTLKELLANGDISKQVYQNRYASLKRKLDRRLELNSALSSELFEDFFAPFFKE